MSVPAKPCSNFRTISKQRVVVLSHRVVWWLITQQLLTETVVEIDQAAAEPTLICSSSPQSSLGFLTNVS